MADIISVAVGGAIGIAGGVVIKLWEGQREKRALAYALAGEVSAILEIVERRKYRQAVRQLMTAVETNRQPLFIQVPITQKYFTVFEANAAKVGLLPRNAARDVACFYTYAKSIIEDVTLDRIPKTAEEALYRLKQLDELLTKLNDLGKRLAKELEGI